METKKFYEQPQAEVVEVKMEGQLLAGSGESTIGDTENPAPGLVEPESF